MRTQTPFLNVLSIFNVRYGSLKHCTQKKNIVRSICMTNTNHASVSMFRFFYGSQHETNLTIALFCFLGWLPLSFELDDN